MDINTNYFDEIKKGGIKMESVNEIRNRWKRELSDITIENVDSLIADVDRVKELSIDFPTENIDIQKQSVDIKFLLLHFKMLLEYSDNANLIATLNEQHLFNLNFYMSAAAILEMRSFDD